MNKEFPEQFKIEFPSEDKISDKREKNEDKDKTDDNNKDYDESPIYYVAYWRKEIADKRREERKEELIQANGKYKGGQDKKEGNQSKEEGNQGEEMVHNQPDEPDYHMGHWINKAREKKASQKGKSKEDLKEVVVKQEIPQEIWEELNSIRKIIQNRIMFLSGTDDVYKASRYSWIKESTQRLRNNNNREDANELSRLGGALTRVRYCRKLLQEGLLNKFVSYIKKLPTEKGASCSIILGLDQYSRLLKIIKDIENLKI